MVIGSWSVVLGYISGALSLEKVCLLDDIVVFQNHSLYQRLKCLGVVACLWLEDNIGLSMVKRTHQRFNT
jgi:hypothetical protein